MPASASYPRKYYSVAYSALDTIPVTEGNVIYLAGTKDVNAFQKVNTKEKCHKGNDSCESDFDFCFHYFLYATNALYILLASAFTPAVEVRYFASLGLLM